MKKIFLDTNVYIIGQLKPDSQEEIILKWLGFFNSIKQSEIKIIISKELINQILRVSLPSPKVPRSLYFHDKSSSLIILAGRVKKPVNPVSITALICFSLLPFLITKEITAS